MLNTVLPPLLVSLFFFLIYFIRLRKTGLHLKYFEAFLFGVLISFIVLLINSVVHSFVINTNHLIQSFVFAALLEKLLALAALLYIIRPSKRLSLSSGVLAGIFFAIGFSLVENIQYSTQYGLGILLPRMLFSVPMHITTCAIMGFFLALRALSSSGSRYHYHLIYALIIPVAAHGTYDFILLSGRLEYLFIPPLVILLVAVMEMIVSVSSVAPSLGAVEAEGLTYEEWIAIRKHVRHEKWITKLMGKLSAQRSYLLTLGKGYYVIFLFVLIAAGVAAIYANYDYLTVHLPLRMSERSMTMVFISFPITVAVTVLLAGIINPKYFSEGVLKIPVISNVVTNPYRDDEETYITYDISNDLCFIKTFEPVNDEVFDVMFEAANVVSPIITVKRRWSNSEDPSLPFGMLIVPVSIDEAQRLKRFLKKYRRIKILNGLFLWMKIPGHERIKKLFIHPSSIMRRSLIFAKDSFIYRYGERADSFYQIHRGSVALYSGEKGEVKIAEYKKGEFFGESDLVGEKKRYLTAKAMSDCEIGVADLSELKALVDNNTYFAYQMILSLSKRVRAIEQHVKK